MVISIKNLLVTFVRVPLIDRIFIMKIQKCPVASCTYGCDSAAYFSFCLLLVWTIGVKINYADF